jgi:hypothetical protein
MAGEAPEGFAMPSRAVESTLPPGSASRRCLAALAGGIRWKKSYPAG